MYFSAFSVKAEDADFFCIECGGFSWIQSLRLCRCFMKAFYNFFYNSGKISDVPAFNG